MSAKTKIVVLHAKELIITGILAAAGLFLILLMVLLFLPDGNRAESEESQPSPLPPVPAAAVRETAPQLYRPGIYKTELLLGGKTIEIETILEESRISSIRLVNLEETVTTMYPLLKPTMDQLSRQIIETQSLEGISPESGAKYTSVVLLDAIRACLEKGQPD